MGIEKPTLAVFDAKPYDRDYLTRASGADKLDWRFQPFRLDAETVLTAAGARAVCVFVNDVLNREALERLAGSDALHRTKPWHARGEDVEAGLGLPV
jgi:lactate dehydrogenase-like 2-hydroxyacid dehydrogenase